MTATELESRQLVLPLQGIDTRPSNGLSIPRADRVFVNRNLRMTGIEWIGFDMDYTLAIYNQDADGRALDRADGRTDDPARLPRSPEASVFRCALSDPRAADRQAHGHILKMDRYKVVHKGYHGLRGCRATASPSSITTSASARTLRATTGSTRCSRSARSRATPRSSTRSRRATSASTTTSSFATSASRSTRRTPTAPCIAS